MICRLSEGAGIVSGVRQVVLLLEGSYDERCYFSTVTVDELFDAVSMVGDFDPAMRVRVPVSAGDNPVSILTSLVDMEHYAGGNAHGVILVNADYDFSVLVTLVDESDVSGLETDGYVVFDVKRY